MTARAEPVGGPVRTPAFRLLATLFGVGLVAVLWRLAAGLGATTALNDGYPWGLWIAFDVVTGTALACGGYAVAILVYVLNKGRFHPLVRPALLTSALGYTMAGFAINLDIGRWWQVWKIPIYFWSWNLNSALLEVALCVMSYIFVLWLELSPALFEKWQTSDNKWLATFSRHALPVLEKSAVWTIALGVLLPTMHQSSLGTLMLLAGHRLHPLWRTPVLPLLFLVSCVSMGYAAVVFEATIASIYFRRQPELKMLAALSAVTIPLLYVIVALRVLDWTIRGQLAELLAFDARTLAALVELAAFVTPAIMLRSYRARHDLGSLFRAAMVMLFAGALFRFDTYLVAFDPGAHWSYFPSVPEMLVTVALVTGEIMLYIYMVKTFPILAGRAPVLAERQAV